jgi:hypothetical protein
MIFNYIPHNSPKHPNFLVWYEKYQEHLKQMFFETVEIIHDNIDVIIDKNDIETEQNFNIFINMIYNASSKYIEKEI